MSSSPVGARAGVFETALDLLFPGRCLLCRCDLLPLVCEPGLPVCRDCLSLLHPEPERRCACCGLPVTSERRLCTRCRDRERVFARVYPLAAYEGALRRLLGDFKNGGRRRVGRVLAAFLQGPLRSHFPGLTVVPVPGRRSVRRNRGWEHMAEVARVLQKRYGFPVARPLQRLPGPPQKSLDERQRQSNLRGRIRLCGGPLEEDEVVLLDDVMTTGATLEECARVLREQAGVRTVYGMTVAYD